MKMTKHLLTLALIAMICLPMFVVLSPKAKAATVPAVVSSSVIESSSSITLPGGADIYLYGYGTGGGVPSGDLAYGQYTSLTNQGGYVVASLAITTSNNNYFSTGSGYPVIGGVGVQGFSSYSSSYGTNNSPAAPSASDSFTVTTSGSLVVVIAIGGDEQSLSVSGLPSLQIDAAWPGSPWNALEILHTYLNAGTYAVTEYTSQSAAGQTPAYAADLIGVFVFMPSTSTSPVLVYSVPITLTNTQPVATSTPLQQMIIINSAAYSSYEAPNLQNIEFFDSNGAAIPSWLESGNTNTATNTVYWLNIANGIPAMSNTTLYMGFASTSTNLFNTQTTGEAPELSPAYGQYDSGANVFPFYDNFAGNALKSLWTPYINGGAITVNNGLTLQGASGSFWGYGAVTEIDSSASGAQFSGPSVFDVYFQERSGNGPNFRFGFRDGDLCNLQDGYGGKGIAVDWGADGDAGEYGNFIQATATTGGAYVPGQTPPNTTFVTFTSPTNTNYNIFSVAATNSIAQFYLNYGTTSPSTINTNIPSYSASIGIGLEENYDSTGVNVSWVRTRSYPPNGVMPSVTVGTTSGSVGLSTPAINGLTVDFNGVASPGNQVTYVQWSWGDGSVDNGWFPHSHTYTSSGIYNIAVTAHYNDGTIASTSASVDVLPGELSGGDELVISAGSGGSVSYTASVGSGTVPPGGSTMLYLAFADDLSLTANPGLGYSFNSWTASPGVTGIDGAPVSTESMSLLIVVDNSATILANFAAQNSTPPASVSVSANPSAISENPLQSSTITATVLDQSGNPLQGFQVSFTATSGVLTSPGLTDSQGQTQVTLTPNSETTSPLTVTVVAYAGDIQNSTTVMFEPPASLFSVATNPTFATISPGQAASTAVTVTSPPGTSESVGIFATWLPPNAVYTVKPAGGSTPYASSFTVQTNSYTSGNPTPPGIYTVTVEGVHGDIIETANFTVTVTGYNNVIVNSGNGGSVNYSYNGNSGTIQSGQNTPVQAVVTTSISLTAIPDSQHTFHTWTITGAVTVSNPSSASVTLNVYGDGTVTANFNSNPVTIISGNGGQVSYVSSYNSATLNSGQQNTIQIDSGGSLSLGAIPSYGYSFKDWTSSSPPLIVIASPSSQSTTATINGGGTITALFNLKTQQPVSVTFSETGLNAGTFWSVNFNGQTTSSSSNTISFLVVSNSQYPWSLSPPNGYTTSTTSGNVNVNSASTIQPITFQKITSTKTASTTDVEFSPNPVPANSATSCTATVTGSNPTGKITWNTSSTTGHFSTSPSDISSGVSSVTYTDTSSGTVTITATYSGDTNNNPSSNSTPLTISASQNHYIDIESQYNGYFLEYLPIENTFSVFTSGSGPQPNTVYGVIDGTNYPFSNPQGPANPYTLTVNMGSLTPGSSLVVYAQYSDGTVLTKTYPLQIIDAPDWLASIITLYVGQKSAQADIGPITIVKDKAGYSATLTENWTIGDGFKVNIPLPAFAGGGDYNILPTVKVKFTFSSDGSLELSDQLNFETQLTFGPIRPGASLTLDAKGDFQLQGSSVNWLSATMSLKVAVSDSQDVPIAGYTFRDTLIGDITIGIDATVTVEAGFTVSLVFAPTQDAAKEFISGLQIMIHGISGQIQFEVGLAVNAGLGIATLTGGGTADFIFNLQRTPPFIYSGVVKGEVSLTYHALIWSGTIWSMGPNPPLYEWPAGTTVADPSGFTVTPRYYNAPYYEGAAWINGSLTGIAEQDIYPYTRISASSYGDSAYILYTTDNVSAPQQYGLGLTGFSFNSTQRTMQTIPMPVVANEIIFNPAVMNLPNGSLLVMWNSIPFSEMSTAANPLDISQTITQYSCFNPNTNSWGPVKNLTTSGVATSYSLSSDSTGSYALVLEGNSISATTANLVEYDVQKGSILVSYAVSNISQIVSFNSLSHMTVLQNFDGSYQLLNLSSLALINMPVISGFQIKDVQIALNSTNTLGILYSNSTSTMFAIYDTSSNTFKFNMTVSQATNYVSLVQLPFGYQIVASDSSGITSYLIVNQSEQQSRFYPMQNITFMDTTLTSQGTLVYATENYGNSSYPLLNLELIFIPMQYSITFNAVGVGTDFKGTVVTIDGINYAISDLPAVFWWDANSVHSFSYAPNYAVDSGKQYVWNFTSGLSTLEIGTMTVTTSGRITANYKMQYYMTVTSTQGTPNPTTGWIDAGTQVTATITSPVPVTTGTQYVCTGWKGTGSIPVSGTASSVTFTINSPSSITWNWKPQYQVSFAVSPSAAGTTTPGGTAYYDAGSAISISATAKSGYTFWKWSSNTSFITFANSSSASTTATINGPGVITATFALLVSGNRHVTLTGSNNVVIITGGNDIIDAAQATATTVIKTGPGNDIIGLGGGNNIVTETAGGNDIITTGNGNNTITITGNGNYQVTTGSGNDQIQITGDGNSIINAGDGNNIVTVSGKGNNQVTTGSGNDVVVAGNGNNIIKTGAGNDNITVGNGNNYVDGGAGYDVCIHGTGHNTILNCEKT